MKRFFDLLSAIIVLICIFPVMILIACAIKFESKGPLLYKQKRVGLNGTLFNIYKFRSMVSNADQIGGYQTTQNDSRITKVGYFIRKTSLDELPQLINIIKGDMSVVGPRPDVPSQQNNYQPDLWELRLKVKPGLTGLSQALYRSQGSAELRTATDLDYVKHHNIWIDLKIIFLTIKQLIINKASN